MILVTGSVGFIGYHLCKKLIVNNKRLVGIDNINDYYDVDLKLARLADLKKLKNFKFFKIDISNKKKLNYIFKKYKITKVIHLAAQAGVRYSIYNPDVYFQSNLIGSQNILDLCNKYNIRHLVFSSSSSVYGDQKKYPIRESDNTDKPLSFYAATKKANEILFSSYSKIYKLPITCLRLFTVYGPYGRPDMAPFKFTASALNNKKITIHNMGKHYRDFTYIDDVIEVIMRIKSLKPRNNFQVYNVCSSKTVSLKYFISLIEKITKKKLKKKYIKKQKGDVIKTYGSNLKLKKDVLKNYKFTSLEDGIKNFINWFKNFYV